MHAQDFDTQRIQCTRCQGSGRLRSGGQGRSGYFSCEACNGNGFKEITVRKRAKANPPSSNGPAASSGLGRTSSGSAAKAKPSGAGAGGTGSAGTAKGKSADPKKKPLITAADAANAGVQPRPKSKVGSGLPKNQSVTGSTSAGGVNVGAAGSSAAKAATGAKASSVTTANAGGGASAAVIGDEAVDPNDVDLEEGNGRKKKAVSLDREDGNVKLNCFFDCTYFGKIISVAMFVAGLLMVIGNKSDGAFIVGILFMLVAFGIAFSIFKENIKAKLTSRPV